jgi:hypothetical protein
MTIIPARPERIILIWVGFVSKVLTFMFRELGNGIYFRRPHWSVRYFVVRQLTRNAMVPYTAARARMVWESMPSDLYRIAGLTLVSMFSKTEGSIL